MNNKTRTYSFFPCNPEQQNLFSVMEGVPAYDALEQAACLLGTARDILAESHETPEESSACYLLQFGCAVLQSVIETLVREQGGHHE